MPVFGLLDSAGHYVVKYRYDACGSILNREIIVDCIASNHNPFIYKGYMYDEETGWYYLQSRFYIPSLCRFLSLDNVKYANPKTIGGLNLYAYCNNNTIMYKQRHVPSGDLNTASFLCISRYFMPLSYVGIKQQGYNAVYSSNEKVFHFFGSETRKSYGWEISSNLFVGKVVITGLSSYYTYTQGNSGVLYAFAGTTLDAMSLSDTTYYAGIGLNLFDIIGAEVQVETLGVGAQVNLWRLSIGANINLIGATSITVGWNTDLGDGTTKTDGFTIGVNTGLLVAALFWLYKLITTGDPSPLPGTVPA